MPNLSTMEFQTIKDLVHAEMQAVDRKIISQFDANIPLINQLGLYIINNGGKRIRPMVSLLAGLALGAEKDKLINCASFVELIHTATLLHDDVVDNSDLRRGKPTANATFGNSASVLVGDFIYTRAFQMMAELNSLPILKVMSDATNVISAGEVQQLLNCNNVNTTENEYMQVIYSKTSRLFEVATQSAGIVAMANTEQEIALQLYGKYLGTAFQLVDDVLDYSASSQTLGKNIGDDFVEGKPTLPLIHALEHASPSQRTLIVDAIENGGKRESLPEIITMMMEAKSLDYAMHKAQLEAQKAVDALNPIPDNVYKEALISLAYLSVDRAY